MAAGIVRRGRLRSPCTARSAWRINGQEHQVKLGVWICNIKSRRDKLSDNQRAALVALGVEWA
ncbi:hypothetical protein ACTMTU_35380 [Streptomyces sp. OZ13]|uniref:hypothetical protein n=1 Tax=Streptomyces sp. OZ13 TaxID=3452210 RepID=UPI003F8C134C